MLAAPVAAIERAVGEATAVPEFLGTLRDAMTRVVRIEVDEAECLTSSDSLERYLRTNVAHLAQEQVRVLFLNSRNALLRDEVMFRGAVNGAEVHPREIMKRALELGATAIILVHNHPSGDPEPSAADIAETRRICRAAATLDIVVHDHFVVGRFGMTSFRARGLLGTDTVLELVSANDAPPQSAPSFARAFQAARAGIGRYFDADLFSDPVFDLLLELFVQTEEGTTAWVADPQAGGAPNATRLRWLAVLCERGLAIRKPHPADRRCWLVSLSPAARDRMRAYVASIERLPLANRSA